MSPKQISRREFVTGVAVAASATVIVACANVSPVLPEDVPTPDLTVTELSPQAASAVRELKVLIVYDSVYGNTAQIAEALIEGVDVHQDSKVFMANETALTDLDGVDLLLVGSPTHGGTFTEPVKNFLSAIPDQALNGVKAAAFDTGFSKETQGTFMKILIGVIGFAAPKIAAQLEAKGASVLSAETFIVLDTEGPLQEGEIERSKNWARGLFAGITSS